MTFRVLSLKRLCYDISQTICVFQTECADAKANPQYTKRRSSIGIAHFNFDTVIMLS